MVNHQLCRSTAIDTALSVAGNQLRPEDRVVRQNRQSGCAPLVAILSDAIRGIVGFVLPAVPVVWSEARFGFIEQASRVELREDLSRLGRLDAQSECDVLQRRKIAAIRGRDAHHIEPCTEQRIRKQLQLWIVYRLVICAPPVVHSIPSACM